MSNQRIKSVNNALELLDIVINENRAISTNEVAQIFNLDRSNAYRILKTLEDHGYLASDRNEFSLGFKLDYLSARELNPVQMKMAVTPIMRKLAFECGENIHLCMRINKGMMFIHQEFSQNAIQVVKKYGAIEPFYCTASGRSVFAFLPEKYRDFLLSRDELIQYTANTVTDYDDLNGIYADVVETGYAEEIEEYNPGVRCISVPIKNPFGWPRYSIGISFPARDIEETKRTRYINTLKVGARLIYESCESMFLNPQE